MTVGESEALEETTELLTIRSRRVVRRDSSSPVSLSVFCANRGASTPLLVCATCEACHGWQLDADAQGGALTCHVLQRSPPPGVPEGPGMRTRISDVMDTAVLCVEPELDIDALIPHMLSRGIDCVPVIDSDGAPIGVVTQTELLLQKHQAEARPLESGIRPVARNATGTQGQSSESGQTMRVQDVMTRGTFALLESAPVARAAALMAYEGTDRIIAISQHGEVVGLLSALDIARWLALSEGFSLPER